MTPHKAFLDKIAQKYFDTYKVRAERKQDILILCNHDIRHYGFNDADYQYCISKVNQLISEDKSEPISD